jgi:hypothetical protein
LSREWRAHFWSLLNIEKVVYLEGLETLDLETLEKEFPDLLESATAFVSKFLKKQSYAEINIFEPFARAAVCLKHRGFREEREVRIVACPQSESALADRGMRNELLHRPPLNKVREQSNSKKCVALFESLGVPLPIMRIIVGPGVNQKKDYEFARSVVTDQVLIVMSKIPFSG